MILITYQDPAGTVRVLNEFNDDEYETARRSARDYFLKAGQVLWVELLLTEMDGDLDSSICLDSWRAAPASFVTQTPRTIPGFPLARKVALWLAGCMSLIVLVAVIRTILH